MKLFGRDKNIKNTEQDSVKSDDSFFFSDTVESGQHDSFFDFKPKYNYNISLKSGEAKNLNHDSVLNILIDRHEAELAKLYSNYSRSGAVIEGDFKSIHDDIVNEKVFRSKTEYTDSLNITVSVFAQNTNTCLFMDNYTFDELENILHRFWQSRVMQYSELILALQKLNNETTFLETAESIEISSPVKNRSQLPFLSRKKLLKTAIVENINKLRTNIENIEFNEKAHNKYEEDFNALIAEHKTKSRSVKGVPQNYFLKVEDEAVRRLHLPEPGLALKCTVKYEHISKKGFSTEKAKEYNINELKRIKEECKEQIQKQLQQEEELRQKKLKEEADLKAKQEEENRKKELERQRQQILEAERKRKEALAEWERKRAEQERQERTPAMDYIKYSAIIDNATKIRSILYEMRSTIRGIDQSLEAATATYINKSVINVLSTKELSVIEEAKLGVRVSALRYAGYKNLAELYITPEAKLLQLPGIGEESVWKIKSICDREAKKAKMIIKGNPRSIYDSFPIDLWQLIRLVYASKEAAPINIILDNQFNGKTISEVAQYINDCRCIKGQNSWYSVPIEEVRVAKKSILQLEQFVSESLPVVEELQKKLNGYYRNTDIAIIWPDFRNHKEEYYAVFDEWIKRQSVQ